MGLRWTFWKRENEIQGVMESPHGSAHRNFLRDLTIRGKFSWGISYFSLSLQLFHRACLASVAVLGAEERPEEEKSLEHSQRPARTRTGMPHSPARMIE
jgi:hypothetical protein